MKVVDWTEHVREERNELGYHIDCLLDFLLEETEMQLLGEQHRVLLWKQLDAMRVYRAALDARLVLFGHLESQG